MRFKLDENLPCQFKDLFAGSSHDVETALNEGLGGSSDSEIASACIAERRVLITLDLDFADIRNYQPGGHSGIIVLRLRLATRDAMLGLGQILIDKLAEAAPIGQLWIVDESRIRIRD